MYYRLKMVDGFRHPTSRITFGGPIPIGVILKQLPSSPKWPACQHLNRITWLLLVPSCITSPCSILRPYENDSHVLLGAWSALDSSWNKSSRAHRKSRKHFIKVVPSGIRQHCKMHVRVQSLRPRFNYYHSPHILLHELLSQPSLHSWCRTVHYRNFQPGIISSCLIHQNHNLSATSLISPTLAGHFGRILLNLSKKK